MRILVAYASKHGATAEIAESIGETLARDGREVEVVEASQLSVVNHDAAVVGSAVYGGRWLRPAMELARKHSAELSRIPVWLFSSGPVGDPAVPEEDPVDVDEVRELLAARGHQVFAGKLDPSTLGFAERAVIRALRAPVGDFRDWDGIRTWAESISSDLTEG